MIYPDFIRGRFIDGLSLLNLYPGHRESDDVSEMLRALAFYGNVNEPSFEANLVKSFDGLSWRNHLLGACALALGAGSERTVSHAWNAFDAGSWVGPQVAVALAMRECRFPPLAIVRIKNLLKLTDERHHQLCPNCPSAEAHWKSYGRPSTYAALVDLLLSHKDYCHYEGELESLLLSDERQDFMNRDLDGGVEIARRWKKGIELLKSDFSSIKPVECQLKFIDGDIETTCATAIACPIDKGFKGSGGLSAQLGGHSRLELQKKFDGPLRPGSLLVMDVDWKKFRRILYILAPRKGNSNPKSGLRESFELILKGASHLGYINIAIPALGTGYGGYTLGECKRALQRAFHEFFEKYRHSPLKTVEFYVKR